jgi:HlyD family secretion protein
VFVVEGETAVKRPIRPGYANATETQVLSGLKVDEAVVVGGKDGLTEGARVRVRNAAR